jgi:hypothetical protein
MNLSPLARHVVNAMNDNENGPGLILSRTIDCGRLRGWEEVR